MEFKKGDLVTLSEMRKKQRKIYNVPKQEMEILKIESIINKKTALVRIDNVGGFQYSIQTRHYRLATENEIKIQEVKRIFKNNKSLNN